MPSRCASSIFFVFFFKENHADNCTVELCVCGVCVCVMCVCVCVYRTHNKKPKTKQSLPKSILELNQQIFSSKVYSTVTCDQKQFQHPISLKAYVYTSKLTSTPPANN